jgi:superfamily I DNA and/or RNA helicase
VFVQERNVRKDLFCVLFNNFLYIASGGIGFLNDSRRLNVAITRAKCSLFLLGKSSILVQNQLWRSLIEDAKDRKMFIPFDSNFWQEQKQLSIKNNLIN